MLEKERELSCVHVRVRVCACVGMSRSTAALALPARHSAPAADVHIFTVGLLYRRLGKTESVTRVSNKSHYWSIAANLFAYHSLVRTSNLLPGYILVTGMRREQCREPMSSNKIRTFLRMSSANVRKAFSMLMLALALVSKNLMPCSLAIWVEDKKSE